MSQATLNIYMGSKARVFSTAGADGVALRSAASIAAKLG